MRSIADIRYEGEESYAPPSTYAIADAGTWEVADLRRFLKAKLRYALIEVARGEDPASLLLRTDAGTAFARTFLPAAIGSPCSRFSTARRRRNRADRACGKRSRAILPKSDQKLQKVRFMITSPEHSGQIVVPENHTFDIISTMLALCVKEVI